MRLCFGDRPWIYGSIYSIVNSMVQVEVLQDLNPRNDPMAPYIVDRFMTVSLLDQVIDRNIPVILLRNADRDAIATYSG